MLIPAMGYINIGDKLRFYGGGITSIGNGTLFIGPIGYERVENLSSSVLDILKGLRTI
jgi:hypothetical protein